MVSSDNLFSPKEELKILRNFEIYSKVERSPYAQTSRIHPINQEIKFETPFMKQFHEKINKKKQKMEIEDFTRNNKKKFTIADSLHELNKR